MLDIVHVVHCIDTEGPLSESLTNTFDRLKNIYGIKLKPTAENLRKIQLKKIDFNGLEDEIAMVFNKNLLNYNNNWLKLTGMLKKITSKKFRNNFLDSFSNGWKYNWFIMDHYGFENNPRKRTLGIHKIWNEYEKFYKKIKIKDNFYFHHHPLSFSKSANHCSTHYFNNQSIIYEILNRKLIDKLWFPSVYRPGFHTIRPDSNWFLEQFIPFDYSNQSVIDNNQSTSNDLSNGRFGDWRRAVKTWSPYNPSHDDYQRPGKCRRYTARCLNIGTRHKILKINDVEQAFYEASKGKPVILSFTNHDYRDMENDIRYVYEIIKKVSQKYKKIRFKWCDARDAMRSSLRLKKVKNKVYQSITDKTFTLEFQKPIFGPQPYLAFKTKKGQYFHDNFDIQKPFYKWTYYFDEHTMNIDKISDFRWAANDKFGSTYIGSIDLKTSKSMYMII